MARLSYAHCQSTPMRRAVANVVEILGGRRRFESMYDEVVDEYRRGAPFCEASLRRLGIQVEFSGADVAALPKSGPLLIIANHPFGVLDGLIACDLAGRLRPNFKLLCHKALCDEPAMQDHLLPIDFAESEEAVETNIASKRGATESLRRGEAVIVFPAGGISTSPRIVDRAVELEWKLFPAKLVRTCKPLVLPLYFHGQNSRLFQVASHVQLWLRQSLIFYEAHRYEGKSVRVTVGQPLEAAEFGSSSGNREITLALRRLVWAMGNTGNEARFARELQLLRLLPSYLHTP